MTAARCGPITRARAKRGEADAISSRYAVAGYDADRRRLRLVRQAVDGPDVSRGERARAEQRLSSLAKDLQVAKAAMHLRVPDRKAPIKMLGFDLDGRLWIERSVAEGRPHEADVYDRAGQWVARMEWPATIHLDLWAVHADKALGVTNAGLGAQRVVRLHFASASE